MPLEMIDRPGRQSPSTVLTKRVTKAIRVMALPDVPSTRQQSGEPWCDGSRLSQNLKSTRLIARDSHPKPVGGS